jgi:hypothetical protein
VNFNIVEPRQMRPNHASERTASDNADPHRHSKMPEHRSRDAPAPPMLASSDRQ